MNTLLIIPDSDTDTVHIPQAEFCPAIPELRLDGLRFHLPEHPVHLGTPTRDICLIPTEGRLTFLETVQDFLKSEILIGGRLILHPIEFMLKEFLPCNKGNRLVRIFFCEFLKHFKPFAAILNHIYFKQFQECRSRIRIPERGLESIDGPCRHLSPIPFPKQQGPQSELIVIIDRVQDRLRTRSKNGRQGYRK